MQTNNIIAYLSLLGTASAVTMSRYAPSTQVEAAFGPYLEQLYASTEISTSNDGFVNFFTPSGQLIVRGNVATGAQAIAKLKEQLLPPGGTKHWNHVPNATTIYSDTADRKTYQVLGAIETRYDGGNCSQAYYSTRFTVTKDAGGNAQLTPHAGNLVAYDDFIVEPSKTPTDIPCGTQ
ncbi:hypothetical protein GGTG_07564 [Gaeumannomyces tritici R3-111a-1]|uniref:SnoaL-like domain-containing protein n=1 Tax=Gaeumannomyces tritici (strain R3-111a-1) TaxID=644352 RepID=J3P216_GAET3|nr:hypothetical protein GGTG_07564 [Gaeumannomyces tritici R3-111a-1]EJT73708.1 hypothetical protein GGTG_07564 [Gaeumannomyces tritici R3-111a-1]